MTSSIDSWQFILTPTQEGSDSLEIGHYFLRLGPGLNCTQVLSQDGDTVGMIIGFPISVPNETIAPATITVSEPAAQPFAIATELREQLAGRYLLLLSNASTIKVFPDASAQIPFVYDRETGRAGSSAHVLLNDEDYKARFDQALFDDMGVDGEGWFLGGLTAHKNIQRLLPNHVFDIETASFERDPTFRIEATETSPEQIADNIVTSVRSQLQILIDGPKKVALALTAGYETRALLACARPFLDQVEFVTIVGNDRHGVDAVIARNLAQQFGLNHKQLSRTVATEQQQRDFLRRGGHCNGDSNTKYHPSIWPLADTHIFVGGMGGEIARGFYWSSDNSAEPELNVETLIKKCGLFPAPQIVATMEHWFETLPSKEMNEILDLLYLENRMGPWYGPQFSSDPSVLRYAPFITAPNTRRMLSLPPQWKLDNRLNKYIITTCWPELYEQKFNSAGVIWDVFYRMQRVAQDPRLVIKKIRKLTA